MALQGSGSISFSQITNEFGTPPGRNLGAYRVSENVGSLSNLPLDDGIPSSGAIRFSNFYGKRLNIVVDLHSIPQDSTRRVARNRYDNNHVRVIGGFRSRPGNSGGTKVFINVNKRIGSDRGSINNVALRTGSWDNNTQLITVIGPNGSLMGAGGDGGSGGGIYGGRAGNGGQGSSAFGIDYPTSVINQGFIFGGRGGGGGGAGGYGWSFGDSQRGRCSGRQNESIRIGGGGGAGGRGFPAGSGGSANTEFRSARSAQASYAGNGSPGTVDSNGAGGGGGSTFGGNGCNRHASSGSGGNIESGGNGGNVSYNNQGSGGQRGYAIIIGPGGNLNSFSGNAAAGSVINGTVS
jgi:hypothetical protein